MSQFHSLASIGIEMSPLPFRKRVGLPRAGWKTICLRLVLVLFVAGFVAASGFAAAMAAAKDESSLRVAVAPFEGDERTPSVADRLAERLAAYPHDRLLPPGSFVAEPGIEPSADAVRGWAYNAAVDELVLGRVVPASDFEGERLEVVLRSGHSGVERARFERPLPDEDAIEEAVGELAIVVLESLGLDVAASEEGGPDVAPGPAAAGDASSSVGSSGRGRGLDTDFAGMGFDGEAPIEIKADEAEIVSRAEGRDLVFQRNVLVRQANVTLRSDRLEASYRRGESEPDRLVAEGRVFVDQDGRQAQCDRAIYSRAAQELICSGHAELVQGCDIVRGELIHFDLSGDRARVQGAASIVIRPEDETSGGCVDVEGIL